MKNEFLNMKNDAFSQLWLSVDYDSDYPFVVTGLSMAPFLLDKCSVVYLRRKHKYCCKRGDILLYQRESGSYVLHRIYKVVSNEILIMNGDSQRFLERINSNQILAEVVRIRRIKKEFSSNKLIYRVCVCLWRFTLPLRPFIFMCKAKICKGTQTYVTKNKNNDK